MSYILDALRRADAERERGAVPSLHTQQYGALPGDDDEGPRRGRLPTIAAGVLAVALLAVLGWHYLGGAAPPRADVQVLAAPPTTTVAARAVDAVPASAAAPMLATADDKGATTSPAPASSATTRRTTKREAPPVTASMPATGRAAAPAKPVAPTALAPATSDRVYAIAELPDDVRRDLPKLAFGGASYSSDPSSRMVILNGQVFHEGDGITRGVVLQRVNRKSAILAVRGLRFELVF